MSALREKFGYKKVNFSTATMRGTRGPVADQNNRNRLSTGGLPLATAAVTAILENEVLE